MGQRLAAVAVVCLASVASGEAGPNDPDPLIQAVLQVFEAHGDQTIDTFLSSLRPAPLAAEDRATVIKSLPRDALRPSRRQLEKLREAERVLEYGGRTGVIVVRPIPLDQAFVGLYFRAVVLASTQALDLLTGEEFAALVAHELGHDYDWNDYWTALQAQDAAQMRQLELRCDGIAVLTLERVGIDPERLASAVRKQTEYNRVQDAAAATPVRTTADRYVPLEQRIAFIRAVARIPWKDGLAETMARKKP